MFTATHIPETVGSSYAKCWTQSLDDFFNHGRLVAICRADDPELGVRHAHQ
jgi:hypothetical protein